MTAPASGLKAEEMYRPHGCRIDCLCSSIGYRTTLIMEAHDSLPYIDADISQAERDRIHKIIQKEIAPGSERELHHSLRPIPDCKFSPLIQKEIARHAAGEPRVGGIDTSRYEAPDEPSKNADVTEWKKALQNAYISSTYLTGRRENLSLLDEFGKNAWLIGNYELESSLKSLTAELAELKSRTEEVNKSRKIAQEDSKGELLALEETWKKGIGKIIEVQVATAQLRSELSQRRRDAAG